MKKIETIPKSCECCGKMFARGFLRSGRPEAIEDFLTRRFCCKKCYWAWNIGERHQNYVDGLRRGHDGGYIRVTDGRYLHRIIMERHLKRPLTRNEHVHHIDDDVTNNDISNLRILTNSQHLKHHAKMRMRDNLGRFVSCDVL